MPGQTHSKRPNICKTENYLQNFVPSTVPENRSYAAVSKLNKKIFVVGDPH